jgi:Protein of unknown function (DUF2695)
MTDDLRDAEFAHSIREAVLGVLQKDRFFELLDNRFCPVEPQEQPTQCGHSYANTIEILNALGMGPEEVEDVIAVMRFSGGCCDCEILLNVAEESRLKSKYWKARSNELKAES